LGEGKKSGRERGIEKKVDKKEEGQKRKYCR
jgi:hypothetical protein